MWSTSRHSDRVLISTMTVSVFIPLLILLAPVIVQADFEVFSYYNHSHATAVNVLARFVDDNIFVVFLGPIDENRGSTAWLELLNWTKAPLSGITYTPREDFDRVSSPNNTFFTYVSVSSSNFELCDYSRCGTVFFETNQLVKIDGNSRCPTLSSTPSSILKAIYAPKDSSTKLYARTNLADSNLQIAKCPTSDNAQWAKAVCTVNGVSLSKVFTVEFAYNAQDNALNILAVLQFDETTEAMCWWTIKNVSSIPDPIIAESGIQLNPHSSGSVPRGLTMAKTNQDYVAYMSYSDGLIYKFFIGSNISKISNYSASITGQVIGDMELADDKLLLVDQSTVILLDVEEVCSEHKDLRSCRQPKDPKCGWCLMSESCTEAFGCSNDTIWIKAEASDTDEEVWFNATHSPPSMARSSPEDLVITLPDSSKLSFLSQSDLYTCVFGLTNITTAGSMKTSFSLKCKAPPSDVINKMFPAGVSVTLPVTIKALQKVIPIVIPYRLVVCSDITSCDECSSSHGSCVWCKNEFKCTSRPSADCPASTDQASKTMYGQGDTCPSVTSMNIRVPANTDYRLSLPITNFPSKDDFVYQCVVERTGAEPIVLAATKEGGKINCAPHTYGTSTNPQSFLLEKFRIDVVTDAKQNVTSAPVDLYDCSYHSVCTHCTQWSLSQSNATSECVWCPASSQCSFRSCSGDSNTPVSDRCPTLVISEITPQHVPVEGGMVLTVKGTGLIVPRPNPSYSIKLSNGQDCVGIKNISTPQSDILTCTLPAMTEPLQSQLIVTINGITWEKPQAIEYYNPIMTNLRAVGDAPDNVYGPVAGGTAIEIEGTGLKPLQHTKDWSVYFVRNQNNLLLDECKITDDGSIRCVTPAVDRVGSYTSKLVFTEKGYNRTLSALFTYKPDSNVTGLSPNQVIAWGGTEFQVTGNSLDSVGNPKANFSGVERLCKVKSSELMTCTFPQFNKTGSQPVQMLMDGNTDSNPLTIQVISNPVFDNFTEFMKTKADEIVLTGSHFNGVSESRLMIFVGEERCNISQPIEDKLIVCKPPINQPENTLVTIYVDEKLRYTLGSLVYDSSSGVPEGGLSGEVIGGIVGGVSALVLILVLVSLILYKRSRYHKERYKTMVKHVDMLESNSRHEIKQAFAELQTDMSDLMSDLNATGIPYWDYKNFTFKILFPGQTDHPSLHKLMTKRKNSVMQALDKFEHLIYNKHFLLIFIHTLEGQPTFTMQDKVQLASLIMLTLQHKMDYATHVIKDLLSELIQNSIADRKHPKLLLRRSESVVEKMLTYWLSLCLYRYLQDHAGTPLFMLFKAIKHQIDKGPVDVLTGEARYSLSQDRLIRQTVDTKPLTLLVRFDSGEEVPVKVNDCDTPSQVKEKILDTVYKNQAYSTRPSASDYNLEWHPGMVGVPISDDDLTSQTANGWKRLNTLAHYSIPNMSVMRLAPKHQAHSLQSDRSRDTDKLFDTLSSSNKGTPRGTLNRPNAHSTSNLQDHFTHNHISQWHLTKNPAQTLPKDRQQTMMSEIFLTRLLKTKGTLQEFIDKFFYTIFSAENLPPTIKFLFDFLDQEAVKNGITDPEVVHVWKNNSLHLRFWVNIIKNPEFVFDIYKSEIVDASLSVIAQTFIDSCAMSEPDFGADAPINKLLFAKDRPKYRKLLQTMYNDIRCQPAVPDQTLNAHLSELSKAYPREFYRNSALKDIYQFAQRYQNQITEELENSFPRHRNPNLATLFRSINSTLEEDQLPVDV